MATLIKAECPACDTEFAVVEETTQDIDELNCPCCLADVVLNDEDDENESKYEDVD